MDAKEIGIDDFNYIYKRFSDEYRKHKSCTLIIWGIPVIVSAFYLFYRVFCLFQHYVSTEKIIHFYVALCVFYAFVFLFAIIGGRAKKNSFDTRQRMYEFILKERLLEKYLNNRDLLDYLENKCNKFIKVTRPNINFLRDLLIPITTPMIPIVVELNIQESTDETQRVSTEISLLKILLIFMVIILVLIITYVVWYLKFNYIDRENNAYLMLSDILAFLKAKSTLREIENDDRVKNFIDD